MILIRRHTFGPRVHVWTVECSCCGSRVASVYTWPVAASEATKHWRKWHH